MSQLSLFDLGEPPDDIIVTQAARPPQPRHGPYADCTWVEAVVVKGEVVSPARWRLSLNKVGQEFVEEYLKKYPKPANIAHRQAPDRANELFASTNDSDEAHQLARLSIVQAVILFDPAFKSRKTGKTINPKAYLSRFAMGAFWRTYRETFDKVDGMVRPDGASRESGGGSDPAVTWANAETAKQLAFMDGAVDARHEVASLMGRLTPEERELISLLYGLNGTPLEMSEVAARKGMREEAVVWTIKAAFARLRGEAEADDED